MTSSDNLTGTASVIITVSADVPPAVTASANVTEGNVSLAVAFSSVATSADSTIKTYDWSFGDGATSTAKNPSHTYSTAGSYTATVTVVDGDGLSATSNPVVITVNRVTPVVTWTDGNKDAVTFSVTPAGASMTGFNYGNGTSGTKATYTYGKAGTYAATVSVTFDGNSFTIPVSVTAGDPGSSGSSEPVVVTPPSVTAPSAAAITAGATSVTTGTAVSFTGSASGTSPTYSWSFGDGSAGSGASVSHSFTAAGTYTVTLTATNSAGTATTTQTVTVTAPAAPATAPASTPGTPITSSGSGNSSVTYTNGTKGSVTFTAPAGAIFDYGDGSSGTSTTHNYPNRAATYDVVVTVNSGSGTVAIPVSVTVP